MIPYTFKPDPYSSHSRILDAVPSGKPLRILDVACAYGYLAKELKKKGHTVIGIEGDKEAGKEAKQHCKKVHITDLNGTLPDIGEKFDFIIFGDVLEHLVDGKRVLEHFLRCLEKEGTVIMSTGNVAHLWIRLCLLFGQFNYTERGILDKTHTHLYTWKSFRKLAKECGLKIIREQVTPVPLPVIHPIFSPGKSLFFFHMINYWITLLQKKLFGFQIILFCKK